MPQMQVTRNAHKRALAPAWKPVEGTPRAGASPPKQARWAAAAPQLDVKLEETESDAAEVLLSFV